MTFNKLNAIVPPSTLCAIFWTPRERLKGNADDDGDEAAEQPMEKMKLEEVENDANNQVGMQALCFHRWVYRTLLMKVSMDNVYMFGSELRCLRQRISHSNM